MFQHESDEAKRVRASLTTRIWVCATFMLAIVTLGFGHAGAFAELMAALAVLGSAGVGTAAVWGAFENRNRSALPPSPDGLRELEERLANLETISRYERRLELEQSQRDVLPDAKEVHERRAKMSLR